jgi:hypothetical protein
MLAFHYRQARVSRTNPMASATARHLRSTIHRQRSATSDELRRRSLARLYERRSAVKELILALERYQDGLRETREVLDEANRA